MLNLKKAVSILCSTLMIMQGMTGFMLQNNKAEAVTVNAAIQDLRARPYPRLMGNQWGLNPDGTFSAGNTSGKIAFIVKYLDYITVNKGSDLFLDYWESTHDPSQGVLKLKNDIYAAALALGRRVYVLPYHNMADVWYYESVTVNPTKNFWFKPDGQNIGSWDYMENHNYWLKNLDGSYVTYSGYTSSQRRFWDSRIPAVQDYWANHAKGIVDQGFDGIFADNWLRSGITDNDQTNVQIGWNTMGSKFKQLAPDKILIGNSPQYNLFTSRDISMLEDRIAPAPSGDKSIPSYLSYSDKAAAAGELCQDTYWDDNQGPFETFRVPMVLLTDNIFGVGTQTKAGVSLESRAQPYLEKLGKIGYPKGPRYRADGILQRDFDSAKVLMNDTSSDQTINLAAGMYKDLNGNSVSSVTLSPYSGVVLKLVSTPVTNLVTHVTKGVTTGNYYVNLTWTIGSSNTSSFEIYQSVNTQDNFQLVKAAPAGSTQYSVNLGYNPTPGTYYYKVIAINQDGTSQVSDIATANLTNNLNVAPSAPINPVITNVTKGATSGNYFINLSWKDTSNNETGFEIYQSINSTDDFKLIKTPAANSGQYSVNIGSSPVAGIYYYKIYAVNQYGKSQPSDIVSTKIGTLPPPVAPSDLTITGLTKGSTSGNYFINLTWKNNSSDVKFFKIMQSINSQNNFQEVKAPTVGASSYSLSIGQYPTCGNYFYEIIAVNDNGESQPSNIVSKEVIAPPAPPSDFTVQSIDKSVTGNYLVHLVWKDNSDSETGYEVQQPGSDGFQTIQTLAANSTSAIIDLGPNPNDGTYTYQVLAVNTAGKSPAPNITSTNLVIPPISPSGLTQSVERSSTGNYLVHLNWQDNSYNETGFEIQQSLNSTNNFQIVQTLNAGITGTTIDLGTNPADGDYYYQVVAINSGGKSQASNNVFSHIVVPPATPSGLTAGNATKNSNGNYMIHLGWQDNSINEAGFEIYQSVNSPDNFQLVATLPANSNAFDVDISAAPQVTTYYYKVVATNEGGKNQSEIANVYVNPIPNAPSNLTSTVAKGATSGNYFVNLSWNVNSNNESGFEIYQSANNPDNFQLIKTPVAGSNNYAINLGYNPVPGTYYYKVVAVNNYGKSQPSNITSSNVDSNPNIPPSVPINLVVTSVTKGATSGNYFVNLSWKDTANNESGFELYQSINSTDNFKLIKTPAANSGQYSVNLGTNPTPATYYYQIVAVNQYGKSLPSNTVNAKVGSFPIPATPSDLSVTGLTKGATSGNYYINLIWKDNSQNESFFELLQSINSQDNFQVIKTPTANATSYCIDLGLTPVSGTYYYQIIAVNDNGKSQPSNVATFQVTIP